MVREESSYSVICRLGAGELQRDLKSGKCDGVGVVMVPRIFGAGNSAIESGIIRLDDFGASGNAIESEFACGFGGGRGS